MKYNVKRLVVLGMLIAVEIVLSRFLSIATDTLKISLAFVPVMIAALLYGPVWAGVVGALADIIGALLFPIGAYFPGFTVTAFLTGMVFGAFLYNRKVKWLDASTAAAVVCVALNMLLNSYVLYLYYVLWLNKANAVVLVIAALPGRVITNSVMIVVQTIIIMLFARAGAGIIRNVRDDKLNEYRASALGYFIKQPELRAGTSAAISERCFDLKEYSDAKTVFCFVGVEKEIDTKAILEKALADGKTLCVPLCENDKTMTARRITSLGQLTNIGMYGIREPAPDLEIVPPGDIDLVFVPCSAVDKKHYRLGKGGRYYDSYLKGTAMFKVALCPQAFVVRALPAKDHDVPVDRVITEKKVF